MKKAVILLSILCVVLVAVLWRNQQSVGRQLEQAAKEIGTISNQLVTSEMKLNHQERLNSSLGGQLTNNTEALAKSASDLAKARTSITQSQGEIRAAHGQLQGAKADLESSKAGASALVGEIEAWKAEVRAKDSELANLRTQSANAETARQAVSQQLAQAQAEIDQLNRQLRNPTLLRAQLDVLEKRLAAAKHPKSDRATPDMRLNLELQPDGTVRVAPPPTTEEQRQLEAELRNKLEQWR